MQKQLGSSFIEIIISMLLLSITLFGLDAMQIAALREARAAYYFSTAIQQLKWMAEHLDSDRSVDFAREITNWNKQNQEVLPQGIGIVRDYDSLIRLAIFWGGATEQTCKTNTIGQAGCVYF